ncbi:MAG: type II secretion system F family protein [Alphaproteobacteria bacterium]
MPQFHYRSVNAAGDVVTGTLEAGSEAAVVARLQALGHTPLSIGSTRRIALFDLLNQDVVTLQPVTQAEILTLTRSLATLLDAGVPLDRALEMTRDLTAPGKLRTLIDQLLEGVREGAGFAATLERHAAAFPPFYRAMVKAGEAGASLDTVLARLAEHMERSAKLLSSVRSALIYPAFLVTAAIGAVTILLAVVVPTFKPMFEDAGAELPANTALVIAMGDFLQTYWWALGLGALALVGLCWSLDASPAGRRWWHGLALRLPLVGSVWVKTAVARISRTLGVLLENGVALTDALTLSRAVAGNVAIAAELERVEGDVRQGRGLARPLTEGGLFPRLAVQLIQVGEETGRLEPMMAKLADIYEEETRTAFDRLLAMLTPILTLTIGLLIAFIISSILFALFSINELAR